MENERPLSDVSENVLQVFYINRICGDFLMSTYCTLVVEKVKYDNGVGWK